MDQIVSYILTVVASAVICGGVRTLFRNKDGISALIQTICGIYMVFVLISPLKEVDFSVYADYFSGYISDAQAVAGEGKAMAQKELRLRIKEETEAYILDKAVSLGAEVSAEVLLCESIPPTPSKVIIKGAVSPYVKTVLSRYMKEQLGIPEEAQMWIQGAA